MPDRCVAVNCSNVADPSRRIFVHTIPFFGDSRLEAIKRRKKWVDFVKMKRAKWEPTKYSALCSKHFTAEDCVSVRNGARQQQAFCPEVKKGQRRNPCLPDDTSSCCRQICVSKRKD